MKKISIFVTLFLIFPYLLPNVFATSETVDLNDLRSFGVPCYQTEISTGTNRIDGVIEEGEFACSNRVAYGEGLELFSVGGALSCPKESASTSAFSQIVQEVFVSYDQEYLYLSACLNHSLKSVFLPRTFPHFGSSYSVTVELSLSPEATVRNRLSRLYQTYYFSAKDLSCSGVEGVRVCSDWSGQTFVGKISSQSGISETCVTLQSGETCNGQWYQNNAVLSSGNDTVFECRIPLVDLLSPLPETERNRVSSILTAGNGELCGSFVLEWDCGSTYLFPEGLNSLALSAGLPAKDPCPLSSDGKTWREYLCQQESLGKLNFDRIGAPLYLLGDAPPLKETVDVLPQKETVIEPGKESAEESSSEKEPIFTTDSDAPPKRTVRVTDPNSPAGTTSKKPTSKSDVEQGNVLWGKLPETFDFYGETTELIPIENSQNETGEGAETVGSVLLVIAGILLFSSTVIAAFFFRSDENKEKVEEKTKKTKK